MKILHLAPLWFPVAPDAAGGRETLLAGLMRALANLGCQNTLIATGDSRSTATLVPAVEKNMFALMGEKKAFDYAFYETHQLALAVERAAEFDIVHSHIGERGFWLSSVPALRGRVLHTYHTPVWEDLEWFVRQHPDDWYSTVSEFQARKFRANGARHCPVVPNGIDVAQFQFHPIATDGLAFLGRMERSKGPDLAVKVARELGEPLTLAGPIIEADYFKAEIEPFLNDRIRYIGTVNQAQRNELLGRAACAVLPFRGAEAFGLVTVEALACGTPAVALANGALPEIIEPGVTGYLTTDERALPGLVTQAVKLNRAVIRQRVAARFDLAAVAQQYRQVYEQMRATSSRPTGA
jgi:glycosyltransferase involved in cell wall biosynthesis